jgi:hypothetical protein
MTAASRSHTSRPGAACARGIDKSSGAARRACSGRYPLRRRSSMARATAFAVMPTPSSSFGRARSHGRPPPSMTSVQGSAPGQGLGIRLCASTRGSIEVFILYEYTSTVIRPCQPQSQENAFRASVATARGQSGRPATCSSPAQALVSVSGRFPGPRAPQENDITKRIQAFVAASAVRPRGGFRQNARLVATLSRCVPGDLGSIRQ